MAPFDLKLIAAGGFMRVFFLGYAPGAVATARGRFIVSIL